jgi:hypothetical protein
MKRFVKLTLFSAALAGLTAVAISVLPHVVNAEGGPNTLTVDVACDCRTGSPAFFNGSRGDAWIVTGKIFPAGTLPSGTATNDPTQAVGGISPIGTWTCRGQSAFPLPSGLPPAVAAAYASTPFVYNTQYYILNDGRALTLEGFEQDTGGVLSAALAITGGVRAFSGASGDTEYLPGVLLGVNATGCPNFRTTFRFQPGSIRGVSK